MNDFNRLNVAMTRMRDQLIVIGDFSKTLTKGRYRWRQKVSSEETAVEHQRWEDQRRQEIETAQKIFAALYRLPPKLQASIAAAAPAAPGGKMLWLRRPVVKTVAKLLVRFAVPPEKAEEWGEKIYDYALGPFLEHSFSFILAGLPALFYTRS